MQHAVNNDVGAQARVYTVLGMGVVDVMSVNGVNALAGFNADQLVELAQALIIAAEEVTRVPGAKATVSAQGVRWRVEIPRGGVATPSVVALPEGASDVEP